MHTRSKGPPLELIDPEIEVSNRRRNAHRRLNQRIRVSSPAHRRLPSPIQRTPSPSPSPLPSPIQCEPHSPILMENGGENNNEDPAIRELRLQLAAMQRQLDEQNARPVPVQNQFAYRQVTNPPVNNAGIAANSFELRPGLIDRAEANAFGGTGSEDANKHLTKFIQISNTVKANGVTDEQVRLRLFPFSLKDEARDWYDSMGPNSVPTWDAMVELFLEKYYPPSETLKRQAEVIQYKMHPQENIMEAWKRFKQLMRRCHNHGLTPGQQILTFYRGGTLEAMRELNMSAGGSLLKLGEAEALEVIERVASNDDGWRNDRSKSYRVASTSDFDRMDTISKQLEFLTDKLGYMGTRQVGTEMQQGVEDVNYVYQGGNSRNFNNYRPNLGGGNYNHYGNKVHPNLSYGNPNNALQPPPGFQVSDGQIIEPKKDELKDVLMAFMKQTGECMKDSNKRLVQVEANVNALNIHMKSIDNQMSQVSQAVGIQHQPGQFPSQTVVNPKDCKDCKAINLRSGKSYEGPTMPAEKEKISQEETVVEEVVEEKEPVEEVPPPKASTVIPAPPTEVKIPFPQRVQKKKLDDHFSRFLDIFRKVNINIPLVEALQQMPTYAKFLKDVLSKKKKWTDYETVNISENCSAIIQKKLPAKLKDPGSFNISCVIGNDRQTKALCDLGASINFMPLSFFRKMKTFFRKMKIGTLKPTTITLQMADRTVTYPKGIVEDVLVMVHDFIFPVDFLVLDMEEDVNVPLIMGRPFLATGKALIDVAKGELTLHMGNKRHILSIYNAMKVVRKKNLL
ncbi:uncharacterized protein LOC121770193 [Salvia splendens]|uniref:uncharacterized protein LOC121770193 n=1 Tax=Salvia splendens TaxID=180675 RepID=UPI001C2715E8|nr:uncharacterized protein LOC121770193 [Salvia splendens]